MTARLLARTLTAIARRVDSGLFNDYPPVGGHDEHRRLLARWFAGLGVDADPRRLLLTGGAHHAVSLALSVVCSPGGTLFTEAQTYPGVIALARHQRTPVVGVRMDAEGIVPEALDQMLADRQPGPAALYVPSWSNG
ncbi:aminotransferase class I/II-fold pyridoxal phosphate-dependent enzyme [Pseudomonas sp. LS1212]|nr:aminotransferase class I/II-fold pyridoxal phosphate-dependent enzyme [Pseudomonas sp. LS1212]UVJ46564.1 aminotransferase class I/II-fold pyridoxal phosphate-dependent enzyme [Pseudomonas sp. LS1212]